MEDLFGVKLEKARTRLGISMRDAAESTKIRKDFLESFEKDHGNFKMPDIYKRGFIKLYARHLKLDPQEILEDFIAYHQGGLRRHRKETRESYGRIDLSVDENVSVEPVRAQSQTIASMEVSQIPQAIAVNENASVKSVTQHDDPQVVLPFNSSASHIDSPDDELPEKEKRNPWWKPVMSETRALYLKVGLIFGGSLALFTLIAILVSSLVSSKAPYISPDLQTNNDIASLYESATEASLVPADTFSETLTLKADGDVHVVIRQENDKERLFAGNIVPNKPVRVTRKGPIKVHFSNGANLVIIKPNGEKVRPGREGIGWIEI